MDTYIHNPTQVEAIRVEKPWAAVQKACPFAHMVKKANGRSLAFYIVSNPGEAETFRAYEGDWIVHYPTGCWAVQTDEQFTKYYSSKAEYEEANNCWLVSSGELDEMLKDDDDDSNSDSD